MADIGHVSQHVRQADEAEATAAFLMSVPALLTRSVQASRITLAGVVDGVPICVFGVARASALSDDGVPWMVGTDGVERHARIFLRQSRDHVEAMSAEYPRLSNHVDARNKVAIRWLRWLGFAIEEPKPWGALGRPFHRFTMEA